jgi:hypothetical protein
MRYLNAKLRKFLRRDGLKILQIPHPTFNTGTWPHPNLLASFLGDVSTSSVSAVCFKLTTKALR